MTLPDAIGRYEVLGLLATGGMAEVLLAKLNGAAGFERAVVVKRVLPHLARQEHFRQMFLDEASVVSGIHHTNVVQVHELGQDSSELYLVMEYVEGETLSMLMRRLETLGEELPFHLAAHIVAEAAAGLHAAHELTDVAGNPRGVVHRDVSPQNIMLGYDGSVKVLDFGIASAVDKGARTQTGVTKGKFAYMSPEQCFATKLDRRSDVFALGIVLFELSTASRLFARDNEVAVVRAICDEAIPSPNERVADYPPRLAAAVDKALARDREARYPTAEALQADLVGALRGLAPESLPRAELAKLMPRLFADRYEKKREMLRRMRTGATLTHIIAADGLSAPLLRQTDPREETQAAPSSVPSMPTATLEPRHEERSRRGLFLGAGAAALLALVAAVAYYGGAAETEAEGIPTATTPVEPPSREVAPPPPVAQPPTVEATPALVRLRVETEPPGATLLLGDRRLGVSPLDVEIERTEEPADLRLELEGYITQTETVIADADLRLRISLPRERRRPRPQGTPTPPSEPGFFRFD